MFKALIATIAITLTPATPKEPLFRWLGHNDYKAINPLLSSIVMTIDCGNDYEKVELPVPARVQEDVHIQVTGTDMPYCHLESWKKSK